VSICYGKPKVEDRVMPKISRRELFIGAAAGATGVAAGGIAGVAVYRSSALHRSFPRYATPSYAQSGEDVIVKAFLHGFKIDRPSYLDIGTWRPVFSNNTYLFYAGGGRGVLVEPNVGFIPEIKAWRPEDTLLNVGIGLTEQKEADYYCYSDNLLNTFDQKLVEERAKRVGGKYEKVVKMPLIPINQVIEEQFHGKAPDFLSTDVEGLDLSILKTLDLQRYRPKVICAETITEEVRGGLLVMSPEITQFLAEKDYEARGMTWANTIYVDKTLLS
jgi:FkbM family methyltransferase